MKQVPAISTISPQLVLMLAVFSAQVPAAEDPVGVVVSPVTRIEFPYRLEALGTARANESIDVTSKISETVTAIQFEEGEEVRAGAVLVELQSAEARANLAEAKASLADSRSQYNRARELYQTRAVSESELERLAAAMEADQARVLAAEARLAETVIRAPFAGRVGLRRISLGSLITPGTMITTLDDTRTIKLDFSVPETFLAPLREGLIITARSVAYPDSVFNGSVTSIDTRVDPVTRSVIVRALVPNPDGLLKPGMFLTVDVVNQEQRSLVVPEQAIVPEKDEQYVFVVADDRAEKRRVITGRRRPGEIEIVEGLTEGELVVIEGTQKVRTGSPVEILKTGIAS